MTEAIGDRGGRRRRLAWLLLLAVPVLELAGHAVIRARVPEPDDWRRAARYVRQREQPGDVITSAPPWTDPLLRRHLGDRISMAEAGRSDLAPYERLWALTIRGHRPAEAPARRPDEDRPFGRVRVLRWDLGPSPVVYDFREHLSEATIARARNGPDEPCRWVRAPVRGGGLGAGPAAPPRRFVCDRRRPWLWVGPTVVEDLSLEPRACIFQHPQGPEPIRATFEDVPLGERIVLYAGLYYEHERKREGGPVQVVVRIDGAEAGRMTHRDGDGWKRMEVSTAGRGDRGTVTVETSARRPHLRSLCWSATVREGERR